MSWKDFTKKYGEYKNNSFLSYPMRRVWRIIVAKEPPYLTENITNYINEIPPNFNVELKNKALYATKEIKKGEELSLEYPADYNRYWLNKETDKEKTGSGFINEEIKGTKKEIINQLYNITNKQEAIDDFMKLKQLTCEDFENNKVKLGSRVGADFVDFFTAPARMETRGNKGLNFWEMLDIKEELKKKKYLVSFFKHYKETNPDYPTLNIWWRFFNMYYGAINQFKPVIAMNLYCKYKPKSILDMTMGWGGRLVGACALNIPKYTGIDLNPDLEKPYAEMVKTLKPMTTTQIKLMFKDALKVDYSKIDYDMVFTSPPYYNIEIYKGTEKQSKEDWDAKFYEPLFRMTWAHLKRGGHYCLNVPNEVYERVCIKLFGKAHDLIPFPKALRTTDEKYKEYIYVWNK